MSFWKTLFNGDDVVDDSVSNTPKSLNTIQSLWNLQKIILDTLDFNQVVQRIVDGLLSELGYLDLGYRIIVLTLVDEEKQILKRISLSRTTEAQKALDASSVPFHDIDIPLSANENLLIKALKSKQPNYTYNWKDIFVPILSEADAIKNQQAAGIKMSMIYPVIVRDKAIGVLIFSMIKDQNEVSSDEKNLIRGFTDIVGLAVQNSQLYSSVEETKKNLEVANGQLKELDKLKDEFVSVASHELRTPMTAIKSYLWMALQGKGGELNEKQKYYIERGYNSVDRLIRLVNDMLNISRIESGRITISMRPIDLHILIQEVVDEVKPRADEVGIKVEFTPKEISLFVMADPDKIREVLLNLIGNSLKFTPKDGKVTIVLTTIGDTVEIAVLDTGSGIEPEDIYKLFQKFGLLPGSYITNQKAMGTGLGLYICKSIIDLHHGRIWASSDGRGKGSNFTFTLKKASTEQIEAARKSTNALKTDNVDLIHTQI